MREKHKKRMKIFCEEHNFELRMYAYVELRYLGPIICNLDFLS